MKNNIKKVIFGLFVLVFAFTIAGCDNNKYAESVELSNCTLNEVEFDNAETVKINQSGDSVIVSGIIEQMSLSQKTTFGVNEVSHVVVLKLTFDKEKTISSFEIEGQTTKYFGEDETKNGYVGNLSDLLDNEPSEDAYCNLILSANTKNYTLKACYSDSTCSVINLSINATLASVQD